MEPVVLHVADYLALLNEVLHDRVPSNEILIEGEVSDYRVAQQKWVSFDLKDEKAEAVLKCFATVWQIGTPIEDGMRVHVKGFPKMYERFGTLKLNVQSIEPIGEGALKRAYDLLKKKLEVEGLFDVSRKRTLPRFPKKIGLITSRDAAAYGDFLRIVNNRWGGIEIDHAHVHVQGREAVPEILGAFRHFNALPLEERPDAIVLTRGGGGLEDLHAFNDEQVARAVYQSIIPVVVAVGHERDESLA
ncbi:exodeoxyribonuclease VII large subunit, partial [Candidatus Uhrbacteria bacterium RIFCSPLOWO2_12_FULL_47_9]